MLFRSALNQLSSELQLISRNHFLDVWLFIYPDNMIPVTDSTSSIILVQLGNSFLNHLVFKLGRIMLEFPLNESVINA